MTMKTLGAFALLLSAAFSSVPAFAESEQKLDQILAKQDEILQKLDEVKAELQIVKVRATQQ